MPAHVELRPLRHAADVDHVLLGGQLEELLPGPRDRLLDEALDRERPAIERDARRWSRGKNRVILDEVLAGRRPVARTASASTPPDEAAGDETLGHSRPSTKSTRRSFREILRRRRSFYGRFLTAGFGPSDSATLGLGAW